MKSVLIFGSNSDLAKKTKVLLEKKRFHLLEYNKKKLNFLKINSSKKIREILIKENPDIILNFAAVLGSNTDDYNEVYKVNFLPNWEIVKHYMSFNASKTVKIIFIGSTSFKKGKGNYILYSSSKAALHNLYQGAKEKFKNTNIKVAIFHPQRFKSKLLNNLNNKGKFQNIDLVVNDLLKKIL
tara:strand:- start:7902 stop:8450 length:549 start_codon:yes stop_codon:yes gene_type:complete